MDNGKDLVINAPDNSRENMYIQSMKLNGEDYDKNYLKHADLANGAVIDFVMGDTPSDWGTSVDSLPTSITKGTEAAEPAMDLTKGLANSAVIDGTVTGNKSALFDDTSDTTASLTGDKTTVTFDFGSAGKSVAMYTVTTGSSAQNMPAGYALYASNDNSNWTCLDERSNVTFEWAKYTKAFSVAEDKRAVYQYYRLEITGKGAVAELELLGGDEVLSEGTPEQDPDDFILGDVDGNNVVNVSDIMTLKNLIMNNSWTEDQLKRGDIDNNKTLNVSDMLSIKNIIMTAN